MFVSHNYLKIRRTSGGNVLLFLCLLFACFDELESSVPVWTPKLGCCVDDVINVKTMASMNITFKDMHLFYPHVSWASEGVQCECASQMC